MNQSKIYNMYTYDLGNDYFQKPLLTKTLNQEYYVVWKLNFFNC